MQVTVAKALKYNSKEWHNEVINNDEFHQFLINNIKELNIDSTEIASMNKHEKGEIKKQLLCFLGCELKKDGVRRDNNIQARTVITFDIEGMNGHTAPTWTDFHEKLRGSILGEQGIAYYWYHTLSHTDDNPRYRLIIPLAKPIKNKDQYEALTKHLAHLIDENIDNYIDTVSFKYNQFIYLPHSFTDDRLHNKLIVGHSGGINLLDLEQFNLDIAPKLEPQEIVFNQPKKQPQQQYIKAFTHDRAIQIFKAYIEVDGHNLQDYSNSLSCIEVLAKAVHNKEIDFNTAIECCSLLALGREDWVSGNIEKFNYEYNNTELRTAYTFRSKFYMIARKKLEPKTKYELYKLLNEEGDYWRATHATINEKTGEIKEKPVNPRGVANILKRNCHLRRLSETRGEDTGELENTKLIIYDLDNGLYSVDNNFIIGLCLEVESTMNPSQTNTVLHLLFNDLKLKRVIATKDEHFIPCKNGIYNKLSGRLLPFSPDFVFTTKLSTNYNPNAEEPYYPDWNFNQWLKDMSDGDKDKYKLLRQVIASVINVNIPIGTAFFFYSSLGSTGKSTFQDLLINLVGWGNIAVIKLKELEDDFKFATIYGKSLVVGDDNNPNDFMESSEKFKSLVTGEVVLVRPIHQKPFNARITPTVIQSMNGLPRIQDTSDGNTRRYRIIKFNKSFKGANNNKNVKSKYVKDPQLLEWLLKVCIDIDVTNIQDTKENAEAVEDLLLDNDIVYRFYEEVCKQFVSTRLHCSFLYDTFVAWSTYNNSRTKMTSRSFTKRIRVFYEADGWTYDRKHTQPLTFFDDKDLKLANDFYKGMMSPLIIVDVYKKSSGFIKEVIDLKNSNSVKV